MKILVMGFILTLTLINYSSEKHLSVPATGTLMKYNSQEKTTAIRPVPATGTMSNYLNN